MRRKILCLPSVLFLWLTLAPWTPSAAQTVAVDLELVLALDVSRSMDDEELELQRQGYAGAFTHQAIIQAIKSGAHGRIAVTMIEWAGATYQKVLIPWTLIDGEDSSENFAAAIIATPKFSFNWTSISGAIDFSRSLFGTDVYRGTRRVIDVSGDGVNNHGRPAFMARDDAVASGITINGLAIINDRPGPTGWRPFHQPPLDQHFREQVIGGPGAFLIVAEDFDSFAFAIRNKLIREISGLDGPTVVIAKVPSK
ncbi:MAG: DUF1194 domain-containing protein [Alphaproteobacteria bacterium]|nr:DUF1194 domain-containing protein [Alphaproteobacteria bacterium]